MIVTLLYPTEGTITYDGIEIQKMGENYRDIIGYRHSSSVIIKISLCSI